MTFLNEIEQEQEKSPEKVRFSFPNDLKSSELYFREPICAKTLFPKTFFLKTFLFLN